MKTRNAIVPSPTLDRYQLPLNPDPDDVQDLSDVGLLRDLARVFAGLAHDPRPDHHLEIRLLARRAARLMATLAQRRRRQP
jgi:hypothetical protein